MCLGECETPEPTPTPLDDTLKLNKPPSRLTPPSPPPPSLILSAAETTGLRGLATSTEVDTDRINGGPTDHDESYGDIAFLMALVFSVSFGAVYVWRQWFKTI
jgi:hypothetical protein